MDLIRIKFSDQANLKHVSGGLPGERFCLGDAFIVNCIRIYKIKLKFNFWIRFSKQSEAVLFGLGRIQNCLVGYGFYFINKNQLFYNFFLSQK